MNKQEIEDALKRNNKWWFEEYKLEFKHRDIYEEIQKFMHTRMILSLTGLRRVGKTTIMFKILEDHLSKLDKNKIVFFSFDNSPNLSLREVLNVYCEITKNSLENGKYLILFDEIQKVENWQEQLKSIYDENPNIKFIISGSESLFIRKKSRESLAGRMFEFEIKPLGFKEYLEFKGKKFDNLILYKEEILKELKKFLESNGFPEIVNENEEVSRKYIRENVIEKIIYKDIPQMIPIKDPSILDQIFKIIINEPGQIINFNELSGELGITRQTLSLYISYLEKSFLIKKLFNFSRNYRKTQIRMKKYYPTIIMFEGLLDQQKFGKIFENFVVLELNADYFWRDSFKNEVDVILINDKSKDKIMPIEIKSGEVKERDLTSLKKFMKKFDTKKALVLSYQQKSKWDTIEIIPSYEYLLK